MYDLFAPRHLTGATYHQHTGMFIGFLNGVAMGRSVPRKLNIFEKIFSLMFEFEWKNYIMITKVYSLFQSISTYYNDEGHEFQDYGW